MSERKCLCGHKERSHRKDGRCRAGERAHQYGTPCTAFVLDEWWFNLTAEAREKVTA